MSSERTWNCSTCDKNTYFTGKIAFQALFQDQLEAIISHHCVYIAYKNAAFTKS